MILKLAAGPLAFLLLLVIPIDGLEPGGQLVVATFGWAMAWWLLQPVPWAVTAVLPVVIFPLVGVLNAREAASLYGQSILFWLMGTSMLGWALEKHGLAKRFAFSLLSIPGVCTTTGRIAFTFMLAIGLLSTVISDLAVIAMAIPIAMSIASSVDALGGEVARVGAAGNPAPRSNLSAFLVLGAFYAAVAGGTATIAGTPPNAISVSILERLSGHTVGWFEWMARGVPIFVILLIVFYFLLRRLFPPEIATVPGGGQFVREEVQRLGPLRRAEWNVLVCFCVMVALFLLGPTVSLVFGAEHRASIWLATRLEIWVVPPVVLLLLFILPIDLEKGEFTLSWRDGIEHIPWSVIFLTLSATAMLDALSRFGFLKLLEAGLADLQLNPVTVPLLGLMLAVATNFVSAIALTAGVGAVLIPAAIRLGLDATTVTMLIPQLAIGIAWPGAGPAAATAFASQRIVLKDMIKAGLIATPLFGIVVGAVHALFELLGE